MMSSIISAYLFSSPSLTFSTKEGSNHTELRFILSLLIILFYPFINSVFYTKFYPSATNFSLIGFYTY